MGGMFMRGPSGQAGASTSAQTDSECSISERSCPGASGSPDCEPQERQAVAVTLSAAPE